MADDKSRRNAGDPNEVSAGQEGDLTEFAEENGAATAEAGEISEAASRVKADDLATLLGKLFP